KLPRCIPPTRPGPPLPQGSSDHTSACLAFPQNTSCMCGSNSVAILGGSHCAPHATASTGDWDKGADSSAPSSLARSCFTSSPLFYHPFLESLPIFRQAEKYNDLQS